MDSKTNAFLIMPRNWDEEAMQQMVAGQKSAAIEAMNTDAGNNVTDSDTYQPLDWKDIYKENAAYQDRGEWRNGQGRGKICLKRVRL